MSGRSLAKVKEKLEKEELVDKRCQGSQGSSGSQGSQGSQGKCSQYSCELYAWYPQFYPRCLLQCYFYFLLPSHCQFNLAIPIPHLAVPIPKDTASFLGPTKKYYESHQSGKRKDERRER
jgi:hypothetical protein